MATTTEALMRAHEDLKQTLGDETPEFVVQGGARMLPRRAYGAMAFGVGVLALIALFSYLMFEPIVRGEEIEVEVNGVPRMVGADDKLILAVPAIMFLGFGALGVFAVVAGIRGRWGERPWFAGTETRLVVVEPKGIRSLDWEQFAGETSLIGRGPKASVELTRRTVEMPAESPSVVVLGGRRRGVLRAGRRRRPTAADRIVMVHVPDAARIERICREHIKRNDPTPATPDPGRGERRPNPF